MLLLVYTSPKENYNDLIPIEKLFGNMRTPQLDSKGKGGRIIFQSFLCCSISALLAGTFISLDRGFSTEALPLMRGAQVNVLEARAWVEVEELWDKLKACGVNTIIVRVYKNPGDRELLLSHSEKMGSGVYFRTTHAPVIEDLLEPLINLSHSKGLKIFAWMTTRKCLWKLDERPDFQEYIYDFAAEKIVPGKALNVFHPEVKDYLIKLYQDLAKYNLDGILIQDDLVLRHNEGFNPIARTLYSEETGKSLLPNGLYRGIKRQTDGRVLVTQYTQQFWQWTRWKEIYLQKFLEYLLDSTKSARPSIKIALNLYYESVISPEKSLAWYSQTISGLCSLPLDYFVVMAYHRQIQKELGLSRKATRHILEKIPRILLSQVSPPEKAVIKLQMIDWDTGEIIPREEIEQIFHVLIPYRERSLIFTPVHNNLPLDLLKKFYHNSQESENREQESIHP